jgi:hypothetical protein
MEELFLKRRIKIVAFICEILGVSRKKGGISQTRKTPLPFHIAFRLIIRFEDAF